MNCLIRTRTRTEVSADVLKTAVLPSNVGSDVNRFRPISVSLRSARVELTRLRAVAQSTVLCTLMTAGVPEQVSVSRFFCSWQGAEEPLFQKISCGSGVTIPQKSLITWDDTTMFAFCQTKICPNDVKFVLYIEIL